ncbi:hypothetical protein ACHHYP_01120 [Achlya hypogyna]|uniref:Uncharacterized protein n=1 Tax=Achlya hypogyna TaxID=1202772 RepID=A0A1V9Z9C4_ACHHY|nr:hypothetical protein ACHHYP_01120 [Achlya hypogyna]
MPVAVCPQVRRRSSAPESDASLLSTPFVEEALPWLHDNFRVVDFSIVVGSSPSTLLRIGCATCSTDAASVLDETKGVLPLDVPSGFLALPSFVYRVRFQASGCEKWGKLRMIQRIYFAKDDVFVRDVRFSGTLPPDGETATWNIQWPVNPFKARVDRGHFLAAHRDQPIRSDIFYFANDRFLAHHRATFRFVSLRVATAVLLQRVEDNAPSEKVARALHIAAFNCTAASLQDGAQLLHTAVSHRAMGTIKVLVAHGTDINSPDAAHQTVLHAAVQRSDFELAWFLLEQGANVDGAVNSSTLTPLHAAIMAGNVAMVELLLHAGATIGPACALRATPCDPMHCDHASALLSAYVWGQPEAAAMLLRMGADANDARGPYPRQTILAASLGLRDDDRMRHVVALLEHGAAASIHVPNRLGTTAMLVAVKRQLHAVVELFVHYQAMASVPTFNEAALAEAAVANSDRRMLEILGLDAAALLPPDAAMVEEAQYDAMRDHLALAQDMAMHFDAHVDAGNHADYSQAALISTVDNEAWMHEIRATGQTTAIAVTAEEATGDCANPFVADAASPEHGLVDAGDDGTMVVTADDGISRAVDTHGPIHDAYFQRAEPEDMPPVPPVEIESVSEDASMNVNASLVEAGDDGTMVVTKPDGPARDDFALGPVFNAYFVQTPAEAVAGEDDSCRRHEQGTLKAVGSIIDAYFEEATLDDGSRVRFDEIDVSDDDDIAEPVVDLQNPLVVV